MTYTYEIIRTYTQMVSLDRIDRSDDDIFDIARERDDLDWQSESVEEFNSLNEVMEFFHIHSCGPFINESNGQLHWLYDISVYEVCRNEYDVENGNLIDSEYLEDYCSDHK